MTIDPKCQNSQPATLWRLRTPSDRANACRTRFGCARPFASLPDRVKEKIIFDDITGLALWRAEGDGHEPPPYWRDEGGDIHNL